MGYDTLYRERAHLASLVSRMYPSEWCEDLDNGESWKILYVHTPEGQVSWHIAEIDWDLFDHVEKSSYAASEIWDGHDTDEKYRRIGMLFRLPDSGS